MPRKNATAAEIIGELHHTQETAILSHALLGSSLMDSLANGRITIEAISTALNKPAVDLDQCMRLAKDVETLIRTGCSLSRAASMLRNQQNEVRS